jgi:hypothetical protein
VKDDSEKEKDDAAERVLIAVDAFTPETASYALTVNLALAPVEWGGKRERVEALKNDVVKILNASIDAALATEANDLKHTPTQGSA